MPLTFRRATISDASLIAEMGARLFAASFGADNTPGDMEKYLVSNFSADQIQTLLADPAATFLLADENGETVGYVMLYAGERPAPVTGPNPVELVRIYLESEFIGFGYGSALMKACFEEAKRNGHETVWLGVWERNQRAIRFYKKWGFKLVGNKEFLLGDDLQNDFVMERPVELSD